MKKKILIAMLVSGFMSTATFAVAQDWSTAKPDKYGVHIQSIEFKNATGYVPYISTASLLDIAAVAAGADVASLLPNNTLPAGTYNKIKITISDGFDLKGKVDISLPVENTSASCCTRSDSTYVPTGISDIGTVKTGKLQVGSECTPVEDSSVGLPSGITTFPDPQAGTSIKRYSGSLPDNGTMVIESDITPFTIADAAGGVAPKYALTFNVATALGAAAIAPGLGKNTSDECLIFPLAPSIVFAPV